MTDNNIQDNFGLYDTRSKDIADSNKRSKERFRQLSAKRSAQGDYYRAVLEAREGVETDGLFPYLNADLILEYTPEQVAMAACHGREDTAAILIIQMSLLKRLDHLWVFMWIAITILLYIAYRLS